VGRHDVLCVKAEAARQCRYEESRNRLPRLDNPFPPLRRDRRFPIRARRPCARNSQRPIAAIARPDTTCHGQNATMPRCEPCSQPTNEIAGELALCRPEHIRVPLLSLHIINGNESRAPTHCKAHVTSVEPFVDPMAEEQDFVPVFLGIRFSNARRFVDAPYRHLNIELYLAFLCRAGDGRGGRRLRRAGERNVTLAGKEPRSGVKTDPSRARQIRFGPSV